MLEQAFVHRSYLNEAPEGTELADNERLEFLGDSVVSFVTSERLYARYPQHQEGELTRLRSSLVRRETLSRVAMKLKLGDYLQLGKGEEESGGRLRPATLCAVFEAVVGAIYLDQGIDKVREFILNVLVSELDNYDTLDVVKDAKSRLQEFAQNTFSNTPRYKTYSSTGPDHAKYFTQVVTIKRKAIGAGEGFSKQEADQLAAAMALFRLGEPAPEYVHNEELEQRFELFLMEDILTNS